ncbi:homoserine dehydrogenase [Empedobacter falsenii]|uniref:Homoserine dehydrogenase n=1 Tax=Empedobacter falsenii TaxID=343874 RepID=A0A376GK23_9FLAO|nr:MULTISPECIES: homoserine dehydrogenase [Empedobacter]MDH1881295.1 homoserine dehydrogenase [Empedobacter sp. GD03797]MDM1040124.1 homoserine dehydrogenase [Empedobacter brevis]MDM1134056.1 homoserine dehydrogenase [Empedobacter sp. R750]MDM1547265.1 homoserine dehydrogenase [Empedobacter falsenii]STD58737.1 Homoserine dehydrogenase [Empedobacter falsenii]
MKKINIGLFGFGVVGEGIYKVLEEKPQLNAAIKKIVIKDNSKPRNAPSELFSTNADDILNDDEINVVVELISDADAAHDIIIKAFNKGKHVVSANKKLIADHHKELLDLQAKNNVSFLYEASVCGSVPIIRNLEEYFDNDLLNYVSGIVNGTTNYILTKMANENESYQDALKAAQESGFAEADPTADVEGFDASSKLAIITLHAFGKKIDVEQVIRKGITSLKVEDFKYAKEKNYTIKLIANSKINHQTGEITSTVLPTFVELNKTIALVNNEYNGVLIGSSLSDEQFLYGKGAGRFPTSSAVLSDISALKYDYQYSIRKYENKEEGVFNQTGKKRIYIGFENQADDVSNIFDEIEERYQSKNYNHIVGVIDIEKLKQKEIIENPKLSIIAFE